MSLLNVSEQDHDYNSLLEVTNLQETSELHVSNNRIESLQILLLPKLAYIDLSYNCLTSCTFVVPDLRFFTSPLAHVNLSHNELTDIEFLQVFPYLQSVNLSHNCINVLDCGIFANHFYLNSLNLAENQISSIITSDTFIEENALETSLRILNLSRNQISDISQLPFTSITNLNISENKLETITGFKFFPHLTELNLESNPFTSDELTSLEVFHGCKFLTNINLNSTKFKFNLPKVLEACPFLKIFNNRTLSLEEKAQILYRQ
ncbi:hypothetical protein RCL1_005235 [Eukaryota sp. TZLM3-RCL]